MQCIVKQGIEITPAWLEQRANKMTKHQSWGNRQNQGVGYKRALIFMSNVIETSFKGFAYVVLPSEW